MQVGYLKRYDVIPVYGFVGGDQWMDFGGWSPARPETAVIMFLDTQLKCVGFALQI
jgi:hypothetical protein